MLKSVHKSRATLKFHWAFSSHLPYCGNSLNILLSTVLFSEKYLHLEMLSFVSTYSWSCCNAKKILCNLPSETISGWKDYNLDFFVSRFAAVCRNLKFWPNYCIRDVFIGRQKNSPEITFSLKTVWTYTIQLKVQRISSYFEKHPLIDISTVIWPNYFTIY